MASLPDGATAPHPAYGASAPHRGGDAAEPLPGGTAPDASPDRDAPDDSPGGDAPPGRAVSEVAAALAAEIAAGALRPGERLVAQRLADRLGVSRFPVGQALRLLAGRGVLAADPGRGFAVAEGAAGRAAAFRDAGARDDVAAVYFRIAEDRLDGRLPDQVTEAALGERYGLSRGPLARLLRRIADEGWAERGAGYGWRFSPVLRTPDALDQAYRMRLAIEPASLLEPGYRLDPAVAARCRAVEEHMLAGGIAGASADALYDRGARFHECIVGASGNPFLLDALQRINRIRRLLVYRSLADRGRYPHQAREHLRILDLLEAGRNAEAADALRAHLSGVMDKLHAVRPLLEPRP